MANQNYNAASNPIPIDLRTAQYSILHDYSIYDDYRYLENFSTPYYGADFKCLEISRFLGDDIEPNTTSFFVSGVANGCGPFPSILTNRKGSYLLPETFTESSCTPWQSCIGESDINPLAMMSLCSVQLAQYYAELIRLIDPSEIIRTSVTTFYYNGDTSAKAVLEYDNKFNKRPPATLTRELSPHNTANLSEVAYFYISDDEVDGFADAMYASYNSRNGGNISIPFDSTYTAGLLVYFDEFLQQSDHFDGHIYEIDYGEPEEVYVAQGQPVSVGSPLFKLHRYDGKEEVVKSDIDGCVSEIYNWREQFYWRLAVEPCN